MCKPLRSPQAADVVEDRADYAADVPDGDRGARCSVGKSHAKRSIPDLRCAPARRRIRLQVARKEPRPGGLLRTPHLRQGWQDVARGAEDYRTLRAGDGWSPYH